MNSRPYLTITDAACIMVRSLEGVGANGTHVPGKTGKYQN